jgi:hypothetical protein
MAQIGHVEVRGREPDVHFKHLHALRFGEEHLASE